MIVIDIETSGTDHEQNSMLSLGAVDYNTGQEFYGECCLRPGLLYDLEALNVNGFSINEIIHGEKQMPSMLYLSFTTWAATLPDAPDKFLLAGHNIGSFDLLFLKEEHRRFNEQALRPFEWMFGYRTVDLHSQAHLVFGKSMKHSEICERLGLQPEPKPHHALNGAKSECKALKMLSARVQGSFRISECLSLGA